MPRKPPRKAANGQGSVRWNDERKRYEYRMTVGFKPNGEAIRKMVTAKTQDELDDRIKQLEVVAKADPKLSTDLTVAEFLNYWVSDVLPLADVTQGTMENYAYGVRLYILPNIPRSGRIPLTDLTPAHVRGMIADLAKQGKSTNTQRLARSILRRALRTAERDGLVPRNVAALTDGIKQEYREGTTMTVEQAKTLLEFVKDHDLEAAVLIMLSLGLRRGELAGLTWDDLKLPDDGNDGGMLRVARAVKKSAAGEQYVDATKTTRTRTLHLPAPIVDALKRHRIKQNETRLAYGPGWGEMFPRYRFVFTNGVGSPIDLDKLNRNVKVLTAQAGIGAWTPHQFRHSAASLLAAQGASPKLVQEILGHSSIRVTMDIYTHLLDETRKEGAALMNQALWGQS